jgi:hypothetical protein
MEEPGQRDVEQWMASPDDYTPATDNDDISEDDQGDSLSGEAEVRLARACDQWSTQTKSTSERGALPLHRIHCSSSCL